MDGKRVLGIDVSEGEEALRFRCDDGTAVVWATDGECCSESWWADGFNLGQLRGAKVVNAFALEVEELTDARTRQEEDKAYGVLVNTERGQAKFVFRNSSNGYYVGWAGLGTGERYVWRELVGNDWSA